MDSAIVATDLMGANRVGPDLIGRLFGETHRALPTDSLGVHRGLPDPVRLGRRMAALYATWQRTHRPDMENLALSLLQRNSVPLDGKLGLTCLAAARAVAAWGGLPYHSARHHAEVATNAMVLLEIANLQGHAVPPHAAGMLLAACLAHDIHYHPSAAKKRFSAEHASADALDAIAADIGCDAEDRATMRALIIATEPGLRLRHGGPLGMPLDATVARLLGRTTVDPALAGLAAILSDADLLSSVGLTTGWYRVQQGRLEREGGRRHRTEENRRFFATIVGTDFLSEPGRLFTRNLALIRHAVSGAA